MQRRGERPREVPKLRLESTVDFDATRILSCGCVICDECRAANALQTGRCNCLDLASIDADFQRVIRAWDGLPEVIRRAIVALVG